MIGCLRTRVRKQPIIALYFESETVLKFYNLKARKEQVDYTGKGRLSRLRGQMSGKNRRLRSKKFDIISKMENDPFKRITCVFPMQMQIVVYICTTSIFIAFKDTLKCQL